jgi:hypothetical protein
MSFQGCLVVERAVDWRIIVGTKTEYVSRDVPTDELVTCVQLMTKLAGLKHPNCVLAPASTSCFFAALETGAEIDVRDRTALVFELEDHLPIDAESMVADFVVLPSSSANKTVASVAIEIDRWREIADDFESAGILVSSIVPAAVLATRSICHDLNFTDTVEVLLAGNSTCDLIQVQSETIVAWKHSRLDPNRLRRHKLLDTRGSDRVIVVGADETQQSMIRSVYNAIESVPGSYESHLIRGADLSSSKASQRWFDLRRDQLGPSDRFRPIQTHLRLVTLAAVACLLAVVIGGWYRTQRIETEIANVRNRQQELFQTAFPNTKVPGALLRRVRSEHARVIGSRGATSQVDIPTSAPEILRTLLAALPQDVRFRIESLTVLNGQVDLDLQVRVPTDAGKLAMSLESAGFDVKPPVTTQQDAKTFDSVLEATWIGRTPQSPSQDEVSVRISITAEVSG